MTTQQQTILRTGSTSYLVANSLYVILDTEDGWWNVQHAAGQLITKRETFREAIDYALETTSIPFPDGGTHAPGCPRNHGAASACSWFMESADDAIAGPAQDVTGRAVLLDANGRALLARTD